MNEPFWIIRDRKTGRYMQQDGKRGPQHRAMVVSDEAKRKLRQGELLGRDDIWEQIDPVLAMQIQTMKRTS